jgi:O-antigen ligase
MGTNETARWLYRTLVLILGLAVLATAALGKDALLYIDEHTGRRYITILATHPSTVADLVAVAFLLGKITRPRPHWATQTVLLVLNLALGSKTSTAILLFIVILSIAVRLPRAVRAVLILTAGASAVAAIMVASTSGYSLGDAALDALQPIYGNRMSEEAATLDGRTELWQVSAELVLRHPLLGFGFDGARRELLASVPWAGHSHNGIVEMLLAGGVLGTMLGLAGWGASATACLRMPANMRWPLISVHLYLFVVALDNPIPMTTQFLGVFLIVWSHACAIEGSSLRAPGLKLSMARS